MDIREIMSNNKIMQFSYLLREQKIKQTGEKTALFHAGIRHNCEGAWCAEKIASWDTIHSSSDSTPNSGNFGLYFKWNGPFRFGPTGILGPSFQDGPVISVGRTKMSLSTWQNYCPQYRSFVSYLQEQ